MPYDELGNFYGSNEPTEAELTRDAIRLAQMKQELKQKALQNRETPASYARYEKALYETPDFFYQKPGGRSEMHPPPEPYSTAPTVLGQMIDRSGLTVPAQIATNMAAGYPLALLGAFGAPETAQSIGNFIAPTAKPAKDVLEGLGELAARTGPMPELMFMGKHRTVTPSDVQVLGARGINTARELKAVPHDFNVGRQGFSVLNPLGEPTIGSKLGTFENRVIGEPQRQKLREAASNVPEDVSYNALRQRVNESYEPGMPMYAVPIGPKSALWDEPRKILAEKMEAEGYTPQEIFAKTLTTRGLDPKHWEQFIPSDKASVSYNPAFKNNKFLSLPDVLKYPALYEAYPWLENYRVGFAGMAPDELGEHDNAKKRITFNNSILDNPKQANSIITHEPIHAIQNHENWPLGGHLGQFPKESVLSAALSIHDLMNDQDEPMDLDRAVEFTQLMADKPFSSDEIKDAVKLVQHGQADLVNMPHPWYWYNQLAGEQQAWLPSKLWGLSEEQLRQTYPYSKDVMGSDPSKTILRRGKMPSGEATYVTSGQLHEQQKNKQALTLAQMKAELQAKNEPPSKEMATKPKEPVNLSKRKLFGLDLTPKQDQLPAVVNPTTSAPTSTESTAPTPSSEQLNTITPADYAVEAIKNMPMTRRQILKTPVNAAISQMGKGVVGSAVKGLVENPVKVVGGMLREEAMKHALRQLENVYGDYHHPLMDGPDEQWDPDTLADVNTEVSHEAMSRLNDVPAEHYAEHFSDKQLRDAFDEGARAWGRLWYEDEAVMQEAANDAIREAISELGAGADEYDLVHAAYPHFKKDMLHIVSQGHPNNVSGELSSAFARSLIDRHGATADEYGSNYLENAASQAITDQYNQKYNELIENIINDEEGGGSSVGHIENMVGAALQPLQKNLSQEKFKDINQKYKELKSLSVEDQNKALESNPTAVKLKEDFLSALNEIPLEDKSWFPFQALNYPASLLEQYEQVTGVDTNKAKIDYLERGLQQFARSTGQDFEPFEKYYLEDRLENETRPKEIKKIKQRLKDLEDNQQNEEPPSTEMAIKNPGGNWSDRQLDSQLKPFKQGLTLAPDSDRYTLRPNWVEIADQIGYPENMKKQMLAAHTLNQWIDKRLKNYIKNDMGTPKDSVRDLADQGITHMQGLGEHFNRIDPNINKAFSVLKYLREERGHLPEGHATTDAGKEWELKTDWSFSPYKIKDALHKLFPDEHPSQEQWKGLQKALEKDPEAELNRFISLSAFGFDHLIDELRNAVSPDSDLPQQLRISTKDLERMTVPDAVRHVSKINKYRTDLAEKATVKNVAEFRQNFPALKTYEDGKAWHELKLPDYQPDDALPEGFYVMKFDRYDTDLRTGKDIKREIYQVVYGSGIDMDRYTDEMRTPEEAIADYNRLKHYGTLDKALKEEGELMGHCVGGYTQDVVDGLSRIFTLRDAKGKPHVTIETNPAKGFEEDDSLRHSHHDVAQIKGKGNKAVSPKYRAEVLDFLNSAYPHSALVEVEDLGFIDAIDTSYIKNMAGGKEMESDIRAAVPDLPRFISRDTWNQLVDQYYVKKPIKGHKDGGYIQSFQSGGPVSTDKMKFNIMMSTVKPPEGYKDGGYIQSFDNGGLAKSPQPGSFPPLFPEIVGGGAHQLREKLFNANAMNISNPAYTLGLNQINAPQEPTYPGKEKHEIDAAAFYNTGTPGQVTINPSTSSASSYEVAPYVLGHEAQHLQEHETSPTRYPPNYQRLYNYYLQRNIEKNFQQQRENLPVDVQGFGYAMRDNVPWEERLADFAGYEAALTKGQTLLDTEFGKKVFNTPALQRHYLHAVRPKEAKAFPVEDTLYEKAKEKYHKFRSKVGEGKSYADAAYETVLNKKDGGSVKSLDHDRMKFELMMRKR